MISQKSYIGNPHGGGWFNRELKLLLVFFGLISFCNLVFSNNTFALFTPTLSASIDWANLQVNGNQVINSTNKTTEIPLNLIVNTNNKTGYTATLNSETDETALVNNGSSTGAKINSISSTGPLGSFSNNTWGYKFGTSSNYAPIPALSTPAQILQTAGKTNGNELNQLNIGMKLADNLESGNYTNKLVISVVSNPYTRKAVMTEGPYFNNNLRSLETATKKIEHFKKSPTPPSIMVSVLNIEDGNSDYEIKLWLDSTDNTAYYYTEPEKVYLNENSSRMFTHYSNDNNFKNILDINLSNFDTSQVTDMSYMFCYMNSLANLNLSNFNTSQVKDMSHMFDFMTNLTTLDLSNFDTSKVTNMEYMFSSMTSLTSLNLSNFDTSQVMNMSYMFLGTASLTTLDLSNFDTSKVTNMRNMFATMLNLTTLNLSSFNTSNVTNMGAMFATMLNLTTLNLSSFDTSKVTEMGAMFADMRSLTTLNLSSFNTSNVTNMSVMFSGMSSLTSLDLSNFDTSNVTSMYSMFYDMSNLTTLDLSNFDTSKVTNMRDMFYLKDEDKLKDKLETIYVNNDFNTAKLTSFSWIFNNRKKLRGGNGSYLADPSDADKTWLRVDRPGVQGYFTRKP